MENKEIGPSPLYHLITFLLFLVGLRALGLFERERARDILCDDVSSPIISFFK